MGGRINGFLSGVLLTASLVYYTGEYIKKDQQFISKQLKVSDTIINEGIICGKDLQKPIQVPQKGNKIINGGFTESAKDIWNEEIYSFVNWVYSINWYRLGMKSDEKILRLLDKATSHIVDNE